MSALSPKADIRQRIEHAEFAQRAAILSLIIASLAFG
jgi:hypothetical protein